LSCMDSLRFSFSRMFCILSCLVDGWFVVGRAGECAEFAGGVVFSSMDVFVWRCKPGR